MELHDLVAPPPAPDFRERLWERAEEWQRRRALRWRFAALVATLVAVAATGAAGVAAFGAGPFAAAPTFDETIRCTVPIRAGIPVVDVHVWPKGWYFGNGKKIQHAASVLVGSDSLMAAPASIDFVSFTSATRGYGALHASTCSPAAAIPLSSKSIPHYDTVKAPSDGVVNAVNLSCFSGTTIVLHQHVRIVHGAPVAAQLAIRSGKKLRPMLYVDWTPTSIAVYATGDCHT
jgi:hypothetical protein